jgi:tetratricopeptide (TPR) repeat protein
MIRQLHTYIIILICLCMVGCSLTPNELKRAEKLFQTSPDSALKVLKGIRQAQLINPADKALYALLINQALHKTNFEITSDSLISIATNYYDAKEPVKAGYSWLYSSRCAKNRGDAEVQASNLLKAQEFAGMAEDYKLRALIYCDKADMYQSQRQMDSSVILNKKGLLAFRKANDAYNAALTTYTIGYVYSIMHQNDSALSYLLLAEKLAKPLNNTILTQTIYKGIGTNYFHTKEYKKALSYYQAAPITHTNVYDYNKWYLIGYTFIELNRLDSAKFYLRKVKSADKFSSSYYSLWQTIYEKEGNYAKALDFSKKVISAQDLAYKYSLSTSFAGIERKYNYEHLQLENKNLVINNKERGIIILAFLLILSIITIISLYLSSRVRKRQLIIQQELTEKEKALLEKANENNELLLRQTKLQQYLLRSIKKHHLPKKGISSTDTKSTSLSIKKVGEEIIAHVDFLYRNISTRLSEQYPNLTANDILLCCMLLADFDSGMIATFLNIRMDSVLTQRGRLRKRLQLENEQSLIDFLSNF